MADNKIISFEESTELHVDPTELAAAKQDAMNDNPECYTHTFKKAFDWEGKAYRTLEFDFSKLTGMDMLAIENELHARGQALVMPTFNGMFLSMLAARACGIGADVLEHAPAPDFNRIISRARSFLLSTES